MLGLLKEPWPKYSYRYLVIGQWSDYNGHTQWNVCIFDSQLDAECLADELETERKKYREQLNNIINKYPLNSYEDQNHELVQEFEERLIKKFQNEIDDQFSSYEGTFTADECYSVVKVKYKSYQY